MRSFAVAFRGIFYGLLLLLTLVHAVPIHAQEWEVVEGASEIRVSEPYEVIDAQDKIYFSIDDQAYAVKTKEEEVRLQSFDPQALEEQKRNVEPFANEDHVHEGTVEVGGRVYCLYSFWDDDKEAECLYYRKENRKKCTMGDVKKGYGYSGQKMAGDREQDGFLSWHVVDKFDFYTSPTGTSNNTGEKLMSTFRLEPERSNDSKSKDKIGFLVFDASMKPQWRAVHEMPYSEEQMDNVSYTITPDGKVYMLAEVREEKEGEGPFHYEVYKFGKGKADFDHARIELKEGVDIASDQVWLQGDPEGGVFVTGFYSAKDGQSYAKGSFVCKVKPSGGSGTFHTNAFSKELIEKYESDKRLRKFERKGMKDPEVGIEYLEIRKSRVYENGDLLLVGEQNYSDKHYVGDNVYWTYHYNDLIVTRLSPEGEQKWIRKLPKEQGGRETRDLSIKLFSGNGKHNIFFFDNAKNLRMKPDEEPEMHSSMNEGLLAAYRVDQESGKVSKQHFFDVMDVKGHELRQYYLHRLVWIGPDRFLFESYKGDKEDVLIGVKF